MLTTKVEPVPVCAAIEVALPTDVITPVRLAFVTTVAALPTLVTPPVKFALVTTVAALPTLVTPPVRFAFVTTVAALPTLVTPPVRLAFVTTVAAKLPLPLPVTPPVSVIVWSPVLAPDTEVVPVTASVGVDAPETTTELTEVGTIAPSVRLIAGVVVEVATVPDTPLAVVTDTLVTVPLPPAATKEVLVPSLWRTLPLAPTCEGSKALSAACAVT